ncbi:MAG TPA: ABC transporter ATP-binding protein [Pirellulales bacterium]|jgi:ATP-binding cassette subfamily B protein|nr:ABC transporter ATP-binding protein [Pirellulales bacterium]
MNVRKLYHSTGRLKESLRWSSRFLWETDRTNCIIVTAVSLINGFFVPLVVVVMAWIVDLVKSDLTGDTSAAANLWPWFLLIGGLALTATVTSELRAYCRARLTEKAGLRANRMILEHTAQISLASLERPELKNFVSSAGKDPGPAIVKAASGVVDLVASVIRLVGLASIMLYIEPLWTVLALAGTIPLVAGSSLMSLVAHRMHLRNTETARWSSYYSSHLSSPAQIASTRVLGLGELMIERATECIRALHRDQRRFERMQMAMKAGATTFVLVVMLVSIHTVIRSAQQGALDFYAFVAFWGAAWGLSKAAPKVAQSFSTVTKAWLSIDHLIRFLRTNRTEKTSSSVGPVSLRGEIIVDRLSFRYPDAQRDALCDVSLCIEPGETVAIVGHNGAGKTTLAKLIAGLYTPASGEIRYDGVAHDLVDFSQLYRRMAVLFQGSSRFEATARENIALGDWQRLSDAQAPIEEIAARLGVDEMIRSLPNGYETRLGRTFGEHELSGGQWQKLAIARALACDPAIVLLDEPNAGLDVYAETDLHRCMQRFVRDRTAVIISHRFTTVMDADRIIVLDDGRLVEQGSHAQLLAKGGYYSAMYKSHDRRAAKWAA